MKPMAPTRPQANTTSKLSRGTKAKSTTFDVGKTTGEGPMSIDRLVR
jgi:hypothetical protein